MFVGHYGVSFAMRRLYPSVPLWVFFIAVQLLDIIWAPFILLGIEHVRITPGITASNPLDLYHMPYTHSLVAAVVWSLAASVAWRAWSARGPAAGAAMAVGLAVLSHWILDAVVHRPDLPLYDNTAKIGLGLWNQPILAFCVESILLLVGVLLYTRARGRQRAKIWIFAVAMVAIHTMAFFGAPPRTPTMAAVMAFGSYVVFAGVAAWLERGGEPATSPTAA